MTCDDAMENAPSDDAATRFSQRVNYLITSDPDLRVAETVGVLVMTAIELAIAAIEKEGE